MSRIRTGRFYSLEEGVMGHIGEQVGRMIEMANNEGLQAV
jgi:hypothetical protein